MEWSWTDLDWNNLNWSERKRPVGQDTQLSELWVEKVQAEKYPEVVQMKSFCELQVFSHDLLLKKNKKNTKLALFTLEEKKHNCDPRLFLIGLFNTGSLLKGLCPFNMNIHKYPVYFNIISRTFLIKVWSWNVFSNKSASAFQKDFWKSKMF